MHVYINIDDAKVVFGVNTYKNTPENTQFWESKKWIFQSVRYFNHDSTVEKETSY